MSRKSTITSIVLTVVLRLTACAATPTSSSAEKAAAKAELRCTPIYEQVYRPPLKLGEPGKMMSVKNIGKCQMQLGQDIFIVPENWEDELEELRENPHPQYIAKNILSGHIVNFPSKKVPGEIEASHKVVRTFWAHPEILKSIKTDPDGDGGVRYGDELARVISLKEYLGLRYGNSDWLGGDLIPALRFLADGDYDSPYDPKFMQLFLRNIGRAENSGSTISGENK